MLRSEERITEEMKFRQRVVEYAIKLRHVEFMERDVEPLVDGLEQDEIQAARVDHLREPSQTRDDQEDERGIHQPSLEGQHQRLVSVPAVYRLRVREHDVDEENVHGRPDELEGPSGDEVELVLHQVN